MIVKLSLSAADRKLEEQFFLVKTTFGRSLSFVVVTVLATVLFQVIRDTIPLDGYLGLLANYVYCWFLAFFISLLGYLYMNNGGHISNWSKSMRYREYHYDEQSNYFVIRQKGYEDRE